MRAGVVGVNESGLFQQAPGDVVDGAVGQDAAERIWAATGPGHMNVQLVLRADSKVVILHTGGVTWSA